MKELFPNEPICCSSITGSLDTCILKLKKHDFARLIFSFKKFQKMERKSLFLSFKNSFSASYFAISQEPLDPNSSWIPLWGNNLVKIKMDKSIEIRTLGATFSNNCNGSNTLKPV